MFVLCQQCHNRLRLCGHHFCDVENRRVYCGDIERGYSQQCHCVSCAVTLCCTQHARVVKVTGVPGWDDRVKILRAAR